MMNETNCTMSYWCVCTHTIRMEMQLLLLCAVLNSNPVHTSSSSFFTVRSFLYTHKRNRRNDDARRQR